MVLTSVKEQGFEVEVIRTHRRRSVAIRVEGGSVSIRVPKRLSDHSIEAMVRNRAEWIRKKLAEQQAVEMVALRRYVSGERISYLGRRYRLKLLVGDSVSVKLMCGQFEVRLPAGSAGADGVRTALVAWMREHAEIYLLRRVAHFAPLVGANPVTIAVRSYKARWGSCSIRGDIRFNWEIIMAPAAVVDYLVVHELSHLIEHNHSAAFWACVEQVCPEYRRPRSWLRHNGHALRI